MRVVLLHLAMLASLPHVPIGDYDFAIDLSRPGFLGRRLGDVRFRPLVERPNGARR